MKGICGPAVCHSCRARVWMARPPLTIGSTSFWGPMRWWNKDKTLHRCKP